MGTQYKIRTRDISVLKDRGKSLCPVCKKPFELGQRVVTTTIRTRAATRHKKCYDNLFV